MLTKTSFYCSVYLDTLTHAHWDGQQRRSHQICPLKEPGRFDVSCERGVTASCIFKAFEWKKLFLSRALAVLVLTLDLLNCAVWDQTVLNLFLSLPFSSFSRYAIVKSIFLWNKRVCDPSGVKIYYLIQHRIWCVKTHLCLSVIFMVQLLIWNTTQNENCNYKKIVSFNLAGYCLAAQSIRWPLRWKKKNEKV